MSIKHQDLSNASIGQSPGCDPKTSKRSSGIFAFFKWFKPSTSRESVTQESSPSSSCDSLNSITSAGTIASFSFVLPTEYKTDVAERNIAPGPETDTYRARLKQRDNRRERDKNVTLRKKYNLFFNRDTSLKSVKTEEDNSKSLPLMTRKNIMESENEKLHRRTNSESSKLRKAGAYCHVKGKRKAPQPPAIKLKTPDSPNMSTMSLRRKKRLAPPPPAGLTPRKLLTSLLSSDKYGTIEYADADIIYNDSLKLDHGILKSAKDLESPNKSPRASYIEAPVSPRPWYKRNRDNASSKKDKEEDRYEPISLYCKTTNAEDPKQHKKKDDKRKSGMSFLTNISELDREATDLIKKEHENDEDAPAFMRLKQDNAKNNTDSWMSPKRRSAKDLIAKFNAITNVTKVTVNSAFFGVKESNAFQKENFKRDYFGNPNVINEIPTKQNKTEMLLQEEDSSLLPNSKNKIPLIKSESAVIIKPNKTENKDRDASVFDKKSWFCPKCSLENDYWRIICYVCSTIKPYFDDLTTPPAKNNTLEKNKTQISEINHNSFSTSDTSKNTPHQAKPASNNVHVFERHLERSRTQIGFSALAKYNENRNNKQTLLKSSSVEEKPRVSNDKQEERERLKKMLIEMKNSLPKRRLNPSDKHTNRASVIQESAAETTDCKTEPDQQTATPESPEKVVEVILASQETIYENIKVKQTANPKPVKVSSSVQTKSIINKSPTPTKTEAFTKQEQSHNFELLRPKEFANIYSVKTDFLGQNTYTNVDPTDNKDLYLSIPAELNQLKNGVPHNTDTLEVNRLLKRLETSIAKGELNEASNYARDLAQLKVNCSVIRQKASDKPNTKGFLVNMYVEDKVSHRGPFPINVHQDLTILELKKQIEGDFQIPAAVQRWIIGKELVTDENVTLKYLKITTEGCPVFLYLVAPGKDAQLNKESNINKVQRDAIPSTSNTKSVNKETNKTDPLQAPQQSPKENYVQEAHISNGVSKNDSNNLLPQQIIKEPSNVNGFHNKHSNKNDAKILPGPSKDDQQFPGALLVTEVIAPQAANKSVAITNMPPTVYSILPYIKEQPTSTNATAKLANNEEIEEYDTKTLKPQNEWACAMCTFLNPRNSNICSICVTVRGISAKSDASKDKEFHYQQLINLDNADLVENVENFECLICLSDILPHTGATLRECLHQFCKPCLVHTIEYTEDAEVKCPFRDDKYSCELALQDREIKALLAPVKYEQFLARSVAQAENKIDKSFHCKTPDCKGWCIFEDNVNVFNCPVCRRTNCLTCQAIHMGLNCKQYQESINELSPDENSKRTKDMLEEMVNKGEAIKCPTCHVILMKKWGCDWLRCSMCLTEICWVTRGPRWGPAGKGDTSGGCRCGVNAIKCHPKCNYCH